MCLNSLSNCNYLSLLYGLLVYFWRLLAFLIMPAYLDCCVIFLYEY